MVFVFIPLEYILHGDDIPATTSVMHGWIWSQVVLVLLNL